MNDHEPRERLRVIWAGDNSCLDDPLPEGLRISTTCPAKRVLDYVEDLQTNFILDGVNVRGHMISDQFSDHNYRAVYDRFGVQYPVLHTVRKEHPVPWCGGTTGIDHTLTGMIDNRRIGVECKTSTDGMVPTADNYYQIISQMWCAKTFGVDVDDWYIVLYNFDYPSKHWFVQALFHINPTFEQWKAVHLHMSGLCGFAEAYKFDAEIGFPELRTVEHARLALQNEDVHCRCGKCYAPEDANISLPVTANGIMILEELHQMDDRTGSKRAKTLREQLRNEIIFEGEQTVPIFGGEVEAHIKLAKDSTFPTIKWDSAHNAGLIPDDVHQKIVDSPHTIQSTRRGTLRLRFNDDA